MLLTSNHRHQKIKLPDFPWWTPTALVNILTNMRVGQNEERQVLKVKKKSSKALSSAIHHIRIAYLSHFMLLSCLSIY